MTGTDGSGFNQKINKDLIEIIDVNCHAMPSFSGDDQDISNS